MLTGSTLASPSHKKDYAPFDLNGAISDPQDNNDSDTDVAAVVPGSPKNDTQRSTTSQAKKRNSASLSELRAGSKKQGEEWTALQARHKKERDSLVQVKVQDL